jgi:rod shape-determining protein MreD
MNKANILHLLWGTGFVFLQIVIFRHLSIYGAEPDVVLIFLIWLTSRRDRTTCILFAATLGFLQDAMLDLWGLHIFSKTLLIMVIYQFLPKKSDTRLSIWQVFLTVFIASLIHYLFFMSLGFLVETYATDSYFLTYWLGNSIYTAVIGSMIYLLTSD